MTSPDRSPLSHRYCHASAGDQPAFTYSDCTGGAPSVRRPASRATRRAVAEKASFALTNSSGTNLNGSADPNGDGQDARSNSLSSGELWARETYSGISRWD